jgi:hypothetical protein
MRLKDWGWLKEQGDTVLSIDKYTVLHSVRELIRLHKKTYKQIKAAPLGIQYFL